MTFRLINTNPQILGKESISIYNWIEITFISTFLIIFCGIILPDNLAVYEFVEDIILMSFIWYIFKKLQYDFNKIYIICKEYILNIKKVLLLSFKYLIFFSILIFLLTIIFALFLKILGLEEEFLNFTNNSFIFRYYSSHGLRNKIFLLGKFQIFLYIFSIVILTPIAEEIWFRRFFYVALRKKMSFLNSVFINSMIFTIFHFPEIIGPFIGGAFLCYVYEREGNIFINVILHSIKNLTAILFICYVRPTLNI